MNGEKIVINGIEYEPVSKSDDVRIVILQRGWVMVGRFEREGSDCRLRQASVIRVWGTSKGLGELVNGPLPSTKLDPCGTVEFDNLTIVASIICRGEAWHNALAISI